MGARARLRRGVDAGKDGPVLITVATFLRYPEYKVVAFLADGPLRPMCAAYADNDLLFRLPDGLGWWQPPYWLSEQ